MVDNTDNKKELEMQGTELVLYLSGTYIWVSYRIFGGGGKNEVRRPTCTPPGGCGVMLDRKFRCSEGASGALESRELHVNFKILGGGR